MTAEPLTHALTKHDFASGQETRWCPGCGDYAILAAVQGLLPELEIPPERLAFVTGIGCAGRFAYYMNAYGLHGIHGRAPAIATGLALARPEMSVWVVTGDGDALAIGGNHLIHALRRNVPLKVLLFNNGIYGLTKGQASPTSALGKITKSTPFGSDEPPFGPLALALGAGATFVARSIDRDREHLTGVLRAAAAHPGAAFVEIFQNCPVFNDGAHAVIVDKATRDDHQIRLTHGEPIRFGTGAGRAVVRDPDGALRVAALADEPDAVPVVHNAHRETPDLAFSLAQLPADPAVFGILRDVEQPVFGETTGHELAAAREVLTRADLARLLRAGSTWTVAAS